MKKATTYRDIYYEDQQAKHERTETVSVMPRIPGFITLVTWTNTRTYVHVDSIMQVHIDGHAKSPRLVILTDDGKGMTYNVSIEELARLINEERGMMKND